MAPRSRLRLLLLAPFLPDMAGSNGGSLYVGTLCNALIDGADLGLVALRLPGEDEARKPPSWSWQATAKYAGQATGAERLPHLLRMGWRWGVRGEPLVVAKHWQREIPTLLARARTEFRPDAVLIELASMAQYLPFLQGVPTVLTDHEAGAPDRSVTDLGGFADRRDLRLWHRYVQRYYPQASLLQALTEEDSAHLHRELGLPVLRRPPVLALAAKRAAVESAPARALFLGDFRHHPNPEAAHVLVREVLPRLRQALPETELWLAGPNEDRIRELGQVPGVRLCGYVHDLGELFAQVRCMVAPLYSGGGFRVKVLTALTHGVPVVTNRLGARGADAPAPARTLAESPAELADAALAFLRSPELAASASTSAFTWARSNLSASIVATEQLARIERLLGR